MSDLLARKFRFFRDCFANEYQSKALWNIFSSKNQHIKYITIEEVEAGEISFYGQVADQLYKSVSSYQREKQLLFGHTFIVSKREISNFGRAGSREQNICLPVIYFPAEIQSKSSESVIVKIDFQKGEINPALSYFFKTYDVDINKFIKPKLEAAKLKAVEEGFDKSLASELSLYIEGVAKKYSIDISIDRDEKNPKYLMGFTNSNTAHFQNANILALIPKQESLQEILYELEVLADRPSSSRPLNKLLFENQQTPSTLDETESKTINTFFKKSTVYDVGVPAILSDSQTQAITNSEKHPLSLLIGPPGTGKSFTIACVAIKEFMQGKSVLVVSQNQHAVDVIRNKLIADFNINQQLVIRGSEKGVSAKVGKQIKELLKNSQELGVLKKLQTENNKRINELSNQLDPLKEVFSRLCELEIEYGESITKKASFWSSFVHFFRKTRLKRLKKSIAVEGLLNEALEKIEDLQLQVHEEISKKINLRFESIKSELASKKTKKSNLSFFTRALSARTAMKQREYFSQVDYDELLKVLPIWCSSLSNLSKLLPFKQELFDVVIIDEATQCNMSVCIPALFRAKRAVIVGDPKQLKHVSFVSYKDQESFFEKHQLTETDMNMDYRNNSVIDYGLSALDSAEQQIILDEHYRSHPHIINFSNDYFYDNELKIMTNFPSNHSAAVEVIQVKGERKRSLNKIEAEAIVKNLRSTVDAQRYISESDATTIGVISFFRDQANYIEKLIFNEFTLEELRKHNIRCGTPFSFQGEERELVLISCCIDADTTGSAYNYLNRNDVFNVAITRARSRQKIFLSCDVGQIKTKTLLKSYIKYCQEISIKVPVKRISDSFQNKVSNALRSKKVRVYKNYILAGEQIDILATYADHSVAIDLIGYPGELEGALSLKKYQLFNRAGLQTVLLPYREWLEFPEKLIETVCQKLMLDDEEFIDDKLFSDEEQALFSSLLNVSLIDLNKKIEKHKLEQAQQQLRHFVSNYHRYIALLSKKFSSTELTYSRYQNAYLSLLSGALKNLNKMIDASDFLLNLQSKEIFFDEKLADEEYQIEMNAFEEERKDLIEYQNDIIKKMMIQNASALIQMDRTIMKLLETEIGTESNGAITQSETELEKMRKKLDLYENKN